MMINLGMKYTVVVNESEYGFDVHCPALPGCRARARTPEHARRKLADAFLERADAPHRAIPGKGSIVGKGHSRICFNAPKAAW